MTTTETEAASLAELGAAEARCTRCPLYLPATQVVPGEGAPQARMMLVGEQPGDREDLAGHPFVGPAGHVLDEALQAAEIPREEVFITNAVKHFKFVPQGKKRLHKRPNAGEIQRCKWWLDQERKLVRPEVMVAMGATALRGLLGRATPVSSVRGQVKILEDGTPLIGAIHPSYLLRIRDAGQRRRERDNFIADLRRAWSQLEAS